MPTRKPMKTKTKNNHTTAPEKSGAFFFTKYVKSSQKKYGYYSLITTYNRWKH